MIDKNQIKNLIERVLVFHNLYSESAVNLILGTMAQESNFGTYIRQKGNGPALSFFQIEKPTFEYLKDKYKAEYPQIQDVKFECLEWNIWMGILFCRLKYLSIKSALPNNDDVPAMAQYWKKYYNSFKGKGKVEEFVSNYHKYVE